jgi:hypothetical protein
MPGRMVLCSDLRIDVDPGAPVIMTG